MSIRDFAAHLGVNDAAVSNWEQRGAKAKLRNETQQLLDTDLTSCSPEVVDRFELVLRNATTGEPETCTTTETEEADLGIRSGDRTAMLLQAAGADVAEATYHPDPTADDRFGQFLDSTARVFVITGRSGSGKTRLSQYLARRWRKRADFQFHFSAPGSVVADSLATEILRYASLPTTGDPLLALENIAISLKRQCIVVLDGVSSEEQLNAVGSQVDSILRQVISSMFRFIFVARTPPDLDLSAFPILAATTFTQARDSRTASYTLMPWTIAGARELWDRHKADDQVAFVDLPESLKSLARVPLYMEMLRDTGNVDRAGTQIGTTTAFHLVDHCVKSVLHGNDGPVEATIECFSYVASDLMLDVVPATIRPEAPSLNRAPGGSAAAPSVPFLEYTPGGRPRFTHDVFLEYFLAIRIVELMVARGRSAATVTAFNDLAAQASRSAAARGVFDFVVCALNSRAPSLVEVMAQAPSISLDTALPMLIDAMVRGGMWVPTDILYACARRCTQVPTKELTQALLLSPNLFEALRDQHAPWVVQQLRTYGYEIWDDVAHHVEGALDIEVSSRIIECVDLGNAAEAAFVARHFDLFAGPGHTPCGPLQVLQCHLDWRVRAALAEALLGGRILAAFQMTEIVDDLVRDADYKVRAAVARAIGTVGTSEALGHLPTLLTDSNWHVRECALWGVLNGPNAPLPEPALAEAVGIHVAGDLSWAAPPTSATKLLTRIWLLDGGRHSEPPGLVDAALVGVLKEIRSGWIELPPDLERTLVARGEESSQWLAVREAKELPESRRAGGSSARERYRLRRGRRALQVALDVHTLGRAVEISRVAVDAGVDLIEVGDPLIKRAGVEAIEVIKRLAPDATVVAEMMSADWGRDQVELAAEAGADVVLLIGPASVASVSAAVAAARRLGVALALDAPNQKVTPTWLRDMERTGVDGFVVTTNIDLGVGASHPMATAKAVRRCSQLPVAVSGGFSPADDALTSSSDWDIAIVGRSIADAVDPTEMATQLASIVRKIRAEERTNDRHTPSD